MSFRCRFFLPEHPGNRVTQRLDHCGGLTSQPISTTRPARVKAEKWEATVKQQTQTELEMILTDLQELRRGDPFRNLNPLRWGAALKPAVRA
jgi:hypothetical protein